MIYLKTQDERGHIDEKILYCWGDVFRETFNPEKWSESVIIEFKTHGKTYEERRENLRDLAISFQNACNGDLYWSEVADVCGWFEKNGKRYGLTREFKENGIIREGANNDK